MTTSYTRTASAVTFIAAICAITFLASTASASPLEIKYSTTHAMASFDFSDDASHDFSFEVIAPGAINFAMVCDAPMASNTQMTLDNAVISHEDNINSSTGKHSPLPLFVDKTKGKSNGNPLVFTVNYEVRSADIAHTPRWKFSLANAGVNAGSCALTIEHNGVIADFRHNDMQLLGSLGPVQQKEDSAAMVVGLVSKR